MKELALAIWYLILGLAIEFGFVSLAWYVITMLLGIPFVLRQDLAVWVILLLIRVFTYKKGEKHEPEN